MAVSKRLRFEVLRRDNHACRYCGRSAPRIKLTVDHVVPVALGGADDPTNLVAACEDCNSGKTSSSPDAPLVANVVDDALRWSAALQVAAQDMLNDLEARTRNRREFERKWNSWTFGDRKLTLDLPSDWLRSVDGFLAAGLPMPILMECVDLAMGNTKVRSDGVFRYMCGIAWARVKELQEATGSSLLPASNRKAATPGATVTAVELVSELWGYLPFEIRDDRIREWATQWKAKCEEDDDLARSKWPDEVSAFAAAIDELGELYAVASDTPRLLLNKLPEMERDFYMSQALGIWHTQEVAGGRDELERFAAFLAFSALCKSAGLDDRVNQWGASELNLEESF